MKKRFIILSLVMLFCLTLVGCSLESDIIGIKDGVAYFQNSKTIPEIYLDRDGEINVTDPVLFEKLRAAIDQKPTTGICDCMAAYRLRMEKYTLLLKTDGIEVIFSEEDNTEDSTAFKVECTKDTMLELFDLIVAAMIEESTILGDKPEDTNLEFWIAEDVSGKDWSEHDEIYGWFGAREFLGSAYTANPNATGYDVYPEHYVSYVISSWPDESDDGYFVTTITITDPAVTVYGLTVNSTLKEFDDFFSALGCELSWVSESRITRVASKDGIMFYLTRKTDSDPDVTPELKIRATTTNREMIVY